MGLKLGSKGLALNLRWYEAWGWAVVIGMLAFGLWGMYDGFSIGSARAGWRFFLLFVIFTLPGFIVMAFFKPDKDRLTD